MPVGSVAGYQAALETTNTAMSYAPEATWATTPATTYQGLRILSESLAHKKTRLRPPEVRGDRQSAPAITVSETATGSIVMPLYYPTTGIANGFDDLISAVIGADLPLPTGSGGGGTLSITSGGLLTLTGGATFNNAFIGQAVKLLLFANTVNNGFYRVTAVNSTTSLNVAGMGFTPVTEAASANGAFHYNAMKNGLFFKSMNLQQRLDPAGTKWFRYPGCYPVKCSITLSLGQFAQATFDFTAQQELKGLADLSTGGIVGAPNTRDLDPVGGFKGVYWNDQPIAVGVVSCGLDISNEGAASEFFLGGSLAQGMIGGTLLVNGKMELAFRDFTFYDQFRAETAGSLSIRFGDQAGNSFLFTMPSAVLLFDDGVQMTGPNKMLTATVTVEGNPDPVSGCTLIVNRFPSGAG